ncbi:hypothetical protein [Haloarcula nitratireducens]|uniref:DUF6788 domain-containing protein n=1 Tax=Haloarcula nitratireducens TaxID=2487749 RepID=A0AAW4PJX9_9EURY|nr:hypothetical protein [Halomicroarcula nitratireducens]MBX0298299.1 hypothetical protein [Halomicroarcula nitratireducens]
MSNYSHTEAAFAQLQEVDRTSLDESAATAYDQAVDHLQILLDELDTATTDDQPTDVETPDDWGDDEWEEQLQAAREKAALPSTKGTLTTKTIDDRDYYYLQWRDGETVRSQYVGPVDPA